MKVAFLLVAVALGTGVHGARQYTNHGSQFQPEWIQRDQFQPEWQRHAQAPLEFDGYQTLPSGQTETLEYGERSYYQAAFLPPQQTQFVRNRPSTIPPSASWPTSELDAAISHLRIEAPPPQPILSGPRFNPRSAFTRIPENGVRFTPTEHLPSMPSTSPPALLAAAPLRIGARMYANATKVTFITSNKTAETVNVTQWTTSKIYHPVQLSAQFTVAKHRLLTKASSPSTTMPSGGFVQTVLEAYRNHHNLEIKPDDIWTAILIQWSLYMNANAEEMRPHFVKFNGTQRLVVEVNPGTRYQAVERWDQDVWFKLNTQMLRQLTAGIVDSDWALAKFSTTTRRSKIVSAGVLMSMVQQYFKYEFRVLCGIPAVSVLGTLQDWQLILHRVQRFRQLGNEPTQWANLLTRVIDKFIQVKEVGNQVDGDFWTDMVKLHTSPACAGKETEQILDGWITVFNVFNQRGKWIGRREHGTEWPRILTRHIASGVVTVPVVITNANGGAEVETTLFAGHMGYYTPTHDNTTLIPYMGWAVAKNKPMRDPVEAEGITEINSRQPITGQEKSRPQAQARHEHHARPKQFREELAEGATQFPQEPA